MDTNNNNQCVELLPGHSELFKRVSIRVLEDCGHSCISFSGSGNKLVVKYCGVRQGICKNIGKSLTLSQLDEAIRWKSRQLKSQGHVCVSVKDGIPPSIDWCEERVCVKRKKKKTSVRKPKKLRAIKKSAV